MLLLLATALDCHITVGYQDAGYRILTAVSVIDMYSRAVENAN